tara:strand:- start:268 stop:606 length:339 start_codon:yes stop_codon:yes gene_type:complete
MINDSSPSSKILIDPVNDLTFSRELVNHHQKNMDRIDELERKLNVENTWRSCCLKTDRRAVIYFSQMIISVGVMGFSCYQLVNLENCEAQSLYSGLLSLVVGIYLPQPKIAK